MKKRKLFSSLLVMLFLFCLYSVIGAKAASFTFVANEEVPSATVENNVVTLTSSKGMIETAVSGVDLTGDIYVSIQVESPIKNLDIFANYYSESSCRLAYKVKDEVSKIGTSETTLTEYNDLGDSLIVTCKVDDKLEELGITELNKILVWLRGSTGDVVKIMNFAITTDGVHGFESNSGETEEPEVPETPVEPGDYVFTTDGNSTEENGVYTLTATRSLITTDVSQMNLDVTSLFMSVKYNFSSDAEGFETKVSGVGSDDSIVSNRDAAGVVAPNTTVGSPWNLTEHVIGDGFIISTIQINEYTKDLKSLTSVTLRLKGVVGTTFELLDFALTADGVHGFDTSSNPGGDVEPEPEDPVGPTFPTEYVFTNDGNVTIDGNVHTLTATRALLNLDVTGMGLEKGSLYVSLKYNFSSDAEGFEIRYSGVASDDSLVSQQDACSVVAPNTIKGEPWNLVEHVIYDDYVISTVQVDNYTGALKALNTLTLRLKGSVGTTFELLDFALTTDGVHGFDVPMSLGEPVGHGLNVVKGEEGYELSYNIDNGSWQYVEFAINAYEAKYDILTLVLDVNANTNICIRLYYDGLEAYKTLRDHWGTDGLVTETGVVTLTYSVAELGLTGKNLTKVEIYLDNPTGTTVNTGEALVKLLKYELIDSSTVLVSAREAAMVEINEAIGSYEISTEEYALALEATMTLEEIESVKTQILEAIAIKKAEIDALNALNEAKQGSIELLEEYIVGYEDQIDITSYKEQILAASTQEDVKAIFNNAKAYVLEKIEEIDAANSLSKTKAEAVNELEGYKASDLYREAEQALLASAVEAGKTAINACETVEAVSEALVAAKTTIDGIKTKAEYEALEEAAKAKELAEAKTNAVNELEGYKASDLYREAEQALLASAVEAGKTAINACETIEAVGEALAAAKTTIDGIKTKAEYEAEEAAKEALAKAKAEAKEKIVEEIGSYEIDKASYEQAIDNANTLEEVTTALNSAISDIKAKKAEIDQSNKPTKKGCFGSVLPSIIGVVALLGACIAIKKKEE